MTAALVEPVGYPGRVEGGQGGKRAQSVACVGVGVSVKVKEIALDVGAGQEIAGGEGIALESCISRVLLFSILYGLGTKL